MSSPEITGMVMFKSTLWPSFELDLWHIMILENKMPAKYIVMHLTLCILLAAYTGALQCLPCFANIF